MDNYYYLDGVEVRVDDADVDAGTNLPNSIISAVLRRYRRMTIVM